MSYAIKKLEEELEIEIFTREGYRPQLTAEGKAIYEKAKLLLLQADELEQLGKHLSMGYEGEIRLAINAICSFSNVIKVLNRFAIENPMCPVKLSVENLGGSIERLLDREGDLVLSELVDFNDQLEAVPWTKIKFLPVAAPGYPPSLSKSPLQKSDMLQYVQIIVSDSSQHSEKKTAGVLKGSRRWTVNDFSIKRNLLEAGSGWGMMPQHMIQKELESGQLVVLNYLSTSLTETMFYLVCRTDTIVGQVAEKLWNALKDLGAGKITS